MFKGTGDRLIKQCMEKICKCFKNEKKVKFVLQYETTKFYFAYTKDKPVA